jgi:integrase/recombinase XerD
MKITVDDDVVLSRPLEGPLSAHIRAFAQGARQQGYARTSRYRRVLLAAEFSRWLGQQAVTLCRVSSDHAARYLQSRARRVRVGQYDVTLLRQFMAFLRDQRVIPAEKITPCRLTPIDQEVEAFEIYLRNDRALGSATVVNYLPFIRQFLTNRFGKGSIRLSRLCAADVVRFVQRAVLRLRVPRAKQLTTALRSFLHYARYRGDVVLDLAAAVPTVANWSMTTIPRAIPADAVRQVLAAMRRRTATERRDYAIVLLLARLGLRAGEVAGLELEDIDWGAGQVSIRGKGGHRTTLPLPVTVGKAIATYLWHGRPHSATRRVFLRANAPNRGFQTSAAISAVVRHALLQAGVQGPTNGAHQFRHALATQMLRHGASLTEIGQVLRHRSPQTTTIYAKVDLDALRRLALPWPGGVR